MGRGARRRPARACIDAITDPDVPPLPPHITLRAGARLSRARWPRATRRAARSSRQSRQGASVDGVRSTGHGRTWLRRRRASSARRASRRYTIPTDAPESDGTLAWDSTTSCVVEAHARRADRPRLHLRRRGRRATLIAGTLADVVEGARRARAAARRGRRCGARPQRSGRPGIAPMAISARRHRAVGPQGAAARPPLVRPARPRRATRVPIYGSGGFTLLPVDAAREQLGGWARARHPRGEDEGRPRSGRRPGARATRRARRSGRRRAVRRRERRLHAASRRSRWARALRASCGVTLVRGAGLLATTSTACACVRDRAPPAWTSPPASTATTLAYFRRMLDGRRGRRAAGRRHALRRHHRLAARRRRCARRAALPLSAHCAPALIAHACCAPRARVHLEYFHDHVRIERLLFDGALEPGDGALAPTATRPGSGSERPSAPTRSGAAGMTRRRSYVAGLERRLQEAVRGEVRFDAGTRRACTRPTARTTARSRSVSSCRARSMTSSRRTPPARHSARRSCRAEAARAWRARRSTSRS